MTQANLEFGTGRLLSDARREVKAGREAGMRCPCCDQFAKLYRRPLNTTMAASLIWLYHASHQGRIFVHVPSSAPRRVVKTNQLCTVAHWGLIVSRGTDDDAKRASGYWRITEKGAAFVRGEILVPARVHLYAGQVEGWSEARVDIWAALGTRFDYADLMRAGAES